MPRRVYTYEDEGNGRSYMGCLQKVFDAGTQVLGGMLVGGIFMGVGGSVAHGCNIGHGLTGIPLLSLGSLLATNRWFQPEMVGVAVSIRPDLRLVGALTLTGPSASFDPPSEFRVEKSGIVHAGIGKASFDAKAIEENVRAFTDAVTKAKPAGAKGNYVKRVAVTSTMGPGVVIDQGSLGLKI